MDGTAAEHPHPQLVVLKTQLQAIHDAIAQFQPPARRVPILDSSLNIQMELASSSRASAGEPLLKQDRVRAGDKKDGKENGLVRDEWTVQGHISGLKKLKDTIRIDLDVLDKFLQSPTSSTLPPLSTNAPYLIAVWNEVLAAQHNGGVKAVFKSFLLDGDERPVDEEDQDRDSDADAETEQTPKDGKRAKGKKSNGKQKGNKEQDKKKTKIDVVADGGTSWIRVNTIKNNRLLSELREIDSYLTDSDSEDEHGVYGNRPSLAQKEFDNSILRMGRTLVQTAKTNTVRVGKADQRVVPRITLRLTRLDPNEPGIDGRLTQTVELLKEMGITVEVGERDPAIPGDDSNPLATTMASSSSPSASSLKPTRRINLDLSVLIALISDLTHAPLPPSVAEAKVRYVPPPVERDWKKKPAEPDQDEDDEDDGVDKELKEKRRRQREDELMQHSRALTNQVLQEMGKSMINEIKDRLLSTVSTLGEVEFWTTTEARDRCLRIVGKIAGDHEKKRVKALFDGDVEAYWAGSRYAGNASDYIPIMPLHYYDDSTNIVHVDGDEDRAPFFHSLERTCVDILGEDGTGGADPHPIYNSPDAGQVPLISGRAVPTKFNPRLTGHTVRTLLWGAKRGWTTLTANRTSVRAVVREVGRSSLGGLGGSLDGANEDLEERAAIWIVDPRSLAEGMRSDLIEDDP